ncbi:MAG: ribbon-helix-helix protein, CopG family [Gloeotrichia echinulata GP01]
MARPKKLTEDTRIVNIRIGDSDWEAFKLQADTMGLNRSELIRQVVQGKISLTQSPDTEKLLLGKS